MDHETNNNDWRAGLFFALLTILFTQTSQSQMYWNQAAELAGNSSSYLVVRPAPELNITGSFTIECWLNPQSFSGSPILVEHRAGNASEGYTLYLNSTGRIAIRTNATTRLTGSDGIPLNTWTHIAGTYNSTSNVFTTYINGNVDSTVTIAAAAPTSSSDSVKIGTGFNGNYNGQIDEIRIWNDALSSATIRRNMYTSLGATGGNYDGLVMSLTMQDADGSGTPFNLTDWSGNGNSAINRGAQAVDMSNRPYTYLAFSQGVELDGTGDYLSGPSTSALDIIGSFTVECWLWPRNGSTPSFQNLVSKRNVGGSGSGYDMYLSNGRVAIRTNGTTRLTGSTVIPNGYWSHFAATYNSTTGLFTVYVDGKEDGSVTVAATPLSNTDSLYIGTGSNSDFSGFIDEVRISKYAKSADDIRRFMYTSINQANEPNSGQTNVVYNLDGNTVDNALDAGPRLRFNGNAWFSNPSSQSNQPVSPTNRADAMNFGSGFFAKSSDRRIPETGTSGLMIRDSLFISQSVSISDINLFVATNHTFDADMEISLIAPNGDSIAVCTDYGHRASNDNIITIFDDQADSSLINSRHTSSSPVIKPQGIMNTVFAGDNSQGYWILHIRDDAGGDTGRLYAWGLQINNQTLVGVEEIAGTTPVEFALEQNYPNPFNPTTTIQFSIPEKAVVRLAIYDILGRQVTGLVNEERDAGTFKVNFDAARFASGTYFYRLEAGSFVQTKKMLLLK